MHIELKEMCHKMLNSVMENLKWDLFENFDTLDNIDIKGAKCETNNLELLLHNTIAGKALSLNSLFSDQDEVDNLGFDDCMVKTDLKYLNYVKRVEINMFLQNKRRSKTKRMEFRDSPEGDSNRKSSFNILVTRKSSQDISNGHSRINTTKFHNNGIRILKNSENGNKPGFKLNNKSTKKIIFKKNHCNVVINSLPDVIIEQSLTLNDSNNLDNTDSSAIDLLDPYLFNTSNKKLLRSSRQNKIKLKQCYDIYSNSQCVNKPIKTKRNRKKNLQNVQNVFVEEDSVFKEQIEDQIDEIF